MPITVKNNAPLLVNTALGRGGQRLGCLRRVLDYSIAVLCGSGPALLTPRAFHEAAAAAASDQHTNRSDTSKTLVTPPITISSPQYGATIICTLGALFCRMRAEMPEPAPAPPPLPPPVRTGARLEIEPDKQWKDDLRKRIEHELRNMVEEAQIMRDTTLNSQPPESSRERALQEYESSMTAIRKLAQENSLAGCAWRYVARQQQWILDNVQKAQDERISSSPQQQRDGEGGSDESFEDGSEGFGDAGSDDEGRASDESRESEEDDDEDEGDEEDAGDSYGHPPRWDGSQPYVSGAAPRHPSPGSRAPSWRPHPRPPEPSGISRTLSYANGQTYSASPAPFPRRGSVNSTGSTGNGAGPHRAGSLNSGQYRSSSVAPHTPSSAERPPTQSRDRIGANISPRERQTPASASPRDRPSPPSYSIGSPRAIPVDALPDFRKPQLAGYLCPQRSPQDMRPGIAIPRGLTTSDEGPRGGSWDSSPLSPRFLNGFNAHRRHNSKGESRLPPVDDDYSDDSDDVVGRLDDRQSMHSARSLQKAARLAQEEAARQAEEKVRLATEVATRQDEETVNADETNRVAEEFTRQALETESTAAEQERQTKGARPGAPRTSPRATRFDEAEWVQRAEERARQQQEQFRREQERLESERQAKSIKVQTQEELIRQLEPTGISGGNSRTATTLGGTASRGPFSSLEADEARRSEEGARRNEEEARREGEETRDKEEEARRKEVREARAEVQTFEERLRATEEELHNCLETLRQTLRQGFDVVHRTKAFIDRQEDALRRK
ncbi:hypothetical protein BJV78DRAFT_1158072 [Lactifluus subvellereus]|nr:hypothetical protein BJV78DRAFT_1158072 [Lactifluus subvellereus]